MKSILVLLGLFFAFNSMASTIKVTSFRFVIPGQYVAELCGVVLNPANPVNFLKVLADPYGNSATYNTIAGKDGKSCLTLVSYRGEAYVTVMNEPDSNHLIEITK